MKYNIIQKFITGKNRPGMPLYSIGGTVHETDDPGATAENEYGFFENSAEQKSSLPSAHVVIDWTTILQLIPFNEKANHAGQTANKRFIGVELCRPSTHDPDKFIQVWNRAVWLFAWYFINVIYTYQVTPNNLMSHDEVSRKWHETDHTDPVEYFAEYGETVDQFRSAVQAEINNQRGLDKMDGCIIYQPGDIGTAFLLSAKLFMPMMAYDDIKDNQDKLRNYKIIHALGGGMTLTHPNVIYHAGDDRFDTCHNTI